MPTYSHSKLSSFEQCPFKFKLRYIDKIIPEVEATIEAHLGKSAHSALEWLYTTLKENPDSAIPSIDDLITNYADYWQKEFHPDMKIVRQELNHKDYFNKGVGFLISYYTRNHPFKEGTIECEKKIFILLDKEGKYKIQGFVDRIAQNIETGEFEIHDYKTANSLPTQEKIDNDRQLALYSIAVKEMFGNEKEVCLVWHYLAHDKKICSRRTNQQLQQLKQETIDLIKKIEETTEFPTKRSALCNWCEYKEMCPEFTLNSQYTKEKQVSLKSYPTTSKYIK